MNRKDLAKELRDLWFDGDEACEARHAHDKGGRGGRALAEAAPRDHPDEGKPDRYPGPTRRQAAPVSDVCRQHNQATAAALLRARDLGLVAHDAIGAGRFHVVAPMLRQALLEVPAEARDLVALSLEVWDALTAAIPYDTVAGGGKTAGADFDEDVMGTFWYQIALGERADHHLAPVPEQARTALNRGVGEE